jgi:hypothetical protein
MVWQKPSDFYLPTASIFEVKEFYPEYTGSGKCESQIGHVNFHLQILYFFLYASKELIACKIGVKLHSRKGHGHGQQYIKFQFQTGDVKIQWKTTLMFFYLKLFFI